MNEGHEIEILLVLCCLVGVIVFLCFSISAVNLSAQYEFTTEGSGDSASADLNWQEELRQTISTMELDAKRLADEIEQKRGEADQSAALSDQKKLAAEKASLQKQLNDLMEDINRLASEIGRLRQDGMNQSESQKEVDRLREDLNQLEKQIKGKRDKLATILPAKIDETLPENISKVRVTIADLDRQIKELQEYLEGTPGKTGIINIGILVGSSEFKNPVLVECSKSGITFHPQGKAVTLDQLKSQNPFRQLQGDPDAIFLFIRPDGFKAFDLSIEAAQKTELPIIPVAYEPDE